MNSSNPKTCIHMPQTSRAFSVDEMQQASEAAGWGDIRYTQLEPGRVLHAYSATADCNEIVLMDEFIDRRIETIGATPAGCITVLTACGSTRSWLNGESFDSSTVMLYQAGAETHIVTHGPSRVLSMHVPIRLLSASEFVNGRRASAGAAGQSKLLRLGRRDSASLRRLMHAAIYERNAQRQQLAQKVSLTDQLQYCLLGEQAEPAGKRRITAASSMQTIDNAREFISANLHRPISMNEVAISSAASVSKLERVFRHQLGLTPSQYIRALRLSVARSALQSAANEGKQVAKIALDCGFTHLSRFSQFYRKHFGESPSETITSRQV